MIIIGRHIINFLCFVLCLIISIVKYSANAPPEIASKNNVFSDIRCFFKTAFLLSAEVINAVIVEITIIYIVKNGIFINKIITETVDG